MATILQELNAAQQAAVTSTAPVLQILAPPGSGKTKTLTSRVAYLINHLQYDPQNVICCTFTIKAAREMRERLRSLVGCHVESTLILGTFHSICRRYLVRYGHLIDIPANFGIANQSDTLSILKRLVKDHNLSIDPKAAGSRISHRKARGFRIRDLDKISRKTIENREFVTIYTEYEAALAKANLFDYDDLLLRCIDLLEAYPKCVCNVEALLIDEFQDTNLVQFELMKLLASANKRITIVGDPDQSIYGFRSAEIENLHKMRASYPDTVVINLEENYRSSSAILKLAQDVIEQDFNRPDKKLRATHCYGTLPVLRSLPNPHEEALWIVTEIKRVIANTGGILDHSDFAILIRSAFLSLLIEKALANAGIPYRMVGGYKFFDRVEIRLVINYLRTIHSPDNDTALLSIINEPPRKLGEKSIQELRRTAEERGQSIWSLIQSISCGEINLKKGLSKPAEQNLQKFVALIKLARKKLQEMKPEETPKLLIDHVVSAICLRDYLKKEYDEDYQERWDNVQEFLTQASDTVELHRLAEEESLPQLDGLKQRDIEENSEILGRFLANIVLSAEVESSEDKQSQPCLTISTIHSAKGLEWPVVFIPAVYEGSIPHSRAEDTDEERRLLYVAMTRAKALLNLSFPLMQSRDMGESTLSQFLPTAIKPRISTLGPNFNDKVIRDLASILRRPCPSQEDLAKSLQLLTEKSSISDDIWPADGSHRRTENWPDDKLSNSFPSRTSNSSYPQHGIGLGNSNDRDFHPTIGCKAGRYTPLSTLSTTMSSSDAFTLAPGKLAFVSASQQLKMSSMAIPNLVGQRNLSGQPQKPSKREEKSDSNQGKLFAFVSQGSFRHNLSLNPVLTTVRDANSSLPPQPANAEPTLPKFRATSIPTELFTHRLSVKTNGKATLKRSSSALEDVEIPNGRKYVFLSSSPPPPETSPDDTENRRMQTEDLSKVPHSISDHASSISPPIPITRPAATMHETSISILRRQQGGVTTMGARKTLGVRRTMGGWEARKFR